MKLGFLGSEVTCHC